MTADLRHSEYASLVERAASSRGKEEVPIGLEPLASGFANLVFSACCRGQPVVVKSYTELVFLRIELEAVGAIDVHAGIHGIGPTVLHSSRQGLVMEFLPGRTMDEADMHRDGNHDLLTAVAGLLAKLHQLPVPEVCQGPPMLWRTIDKMIEVVRLRPELFPAALGDIQAITAEIQRSRAELEKEKFPVVLCHGDFKPSNVIEHEGRVRLIDFELGGPNYRGFDLMKIFRTAHGPQESCMRHFCAAYKAALGTGCKDTVDSLMEEAKAFEALTWLEAACFFLTMPQFKPAESSRWNELALDRWAKFQEIRRCFRAESATGR